MIGRSAYRQEGGDAWAKSYLQLPCFAIEVTAVFAVGCIVPLMPIESQTDTHLMAFQDSLDKPAPERSNQSGL